jgi:hypothetical protein
MLVGSAGIPCVVVLRISAPEKSHLLVDSSIDGYYYLW